MNPLALITGASSGIGETYAGILARQGYDLIVAVFDKQTLSYTIIFMKLSDNAKQVSIYYRICSWFKVSKLRDY